MNIVSSCSDYAMVGVLSVVKRILNVFQIIAPIVCMIHLTITFIKLMKDPDDKKKLSQIKNTILSLFAVFFVPVFVNVVFGMLDDSTPLSSCWELANYTYSSPVYIPVDDRQKTTIISNPSDYSSGGTNGGTKTGNIEELIYYNQTLYKSFSFCSGKNTVASSGCGAVSFAMIASTYVNPDYDPIAVSKWFCQNKYNLSNGGLDEDAVSSADTLRHFGLKGEVLFDKTGGSSLNYGTSYKSSEGSRILAAVQSGKSVMLGVPGHWVVAGPNASCSSDQIYLYNPSRVTSNGCYTMEQLFQFTYNYSNRCSTRSWCGWDVALALSS